MTNFERIDASGLACPQPVILAKKAIENHEQVEIVVDNAAAVENIKRLATKLGCSFHVEEKKTGAYVVQLTRNKESIPSVVGTDDMACINGNKQAGHLVIVFSENTMGRGDQELGEVLVRAFLHTLCQRAPLPDTIIFYNKGVLLTVYDSAVIEDLQQLAAKGVDLLVCGTCVNYFGISPNIGVGTISNMYDIAEAMCGAGRLVMP